MIEIDRSDIVFLGGFIFCQLIQFLGPYFIPPNWLLHVYSLTVVGFLAVFFGSQELLKWQAAEYAHLSAIIRPHNKIFHLFIKKRSSREVNEEEGIYATSLELAVPIKHPFYDKVNQIVVIHEREWEDRIRYTHGKAYFKGYWVEHPNTAKVTLYETGCFDLDHLNPIPVFHLVEAPGDYYVPLEMPPKQEEAFTVEAVTDGGGS